MAGGEAGGLGAAQAQPNLAQGYDWGQLLLVPVVVNATTHNCNHWELFIVATKWLIFGFLMVSK